MAARDATTWRRTCHCAVGRRRASPAGRLPRRGVTRVLVQARAELVHELDRAREDGVELVQLFGRSIELGAEPLVVQARGQGLVPELVVAVERAPDRLD